MIHWSLLNSHLNCFPSMTRRCDYWSAITFSTTSKRSTRRNTMISSTKRSRHCCSRSWQRTTESQRDELSLSYRNFIDDESGWMLVLSMVIYHDYCPCHDCSFLCHHSYYHVSLLLSLHYCIIVMYHYCFIMMITSLLS